MNGEAEWVTKLMELMEAVDTWIPIPPSVTKTKIFDAG
jgi:elongation factor Tu